MAKRVYHKAFVPAVRNPEDEVTDLFSVSLIPLKPDRDSQLLFWRNILFGKEKFEPHIDTLAIGPAIDGKNPKYVYARAEYWSSLYSGGFISLVKLVDALNSDIKKLLLTGRFGDWTEENVLDYAPKFELKEWSEDHYPYLHYAHQNIPPRLSQAGIGIYITPRLAGVLDCDSWDFNYPKCGWRKHSTTAPTPQIPLRFVKFQQNFSGIEQNIEHLLASTSSYTWDGTTYLNHHRHGNKLIKYTFSYQNTISSIEEGVRKYGSVEGWLNQEVGEKLGLDYPDWITTFAAFNIQNRPFSSLSIAIVPKRGWKNVILQVAPEVIPYLNWNSNLLIDGTSGYQEVEMAHVGEKGSVVFNYGNPEKTTKPVGQIYNELEKDDMTYGASNLTAYRVYTTPPPKEEPGVLFEFINNLPRSAHTVTPEEKLPEHCPGRLCSDQPEFNFYLKNKGLPQTLDLETLAVLLRVRIVKEASGESLAPNYKVLFNAEKMMSYFFGRKRIYLRDNTDQFYEMIHRSSTEYGAEADEEDILGVFNERNKAVGGLLDALKKLDFSESKAVVFHIPLFYMGELPKFSLLFLKGARIKVELNPLERYMTVKNTANNQPVDCFMVIEDVRLIALQHKFTIDTWEKFRPCWETHTIFYGGMSFEYSPLASIHDNSRQMWTYRSPVPVKHNSDIVAYILMVKRRDSVKSDCAYDVDNIISVELETTSLGTLGCIPKNWIYEFLPGGENSHKKTVQAMYENISKTGRGGRVLEDFETFARRKNSLFTFIPDSTNQLWKEYGREEEFYFNVRTKTERADLKLGLFLLKKRSLRVEKDWTITGLEKLHFID